MEQATATKSALVAAIANSGASDKSKQNSDQMESLHEKAAAELLAAIKKDDAKGLSKSLRNIFKSLRNQE